MRIVTATEMQALEQQAHAAGVPYETMMDNAGRAVAATVRDQVLRKPGSVLILVGPGNNGGDGLVAAHYLAQLDYAVAVYVWRRDDDVLLQRALADGATIIQAEQDADGARLTEQVLQADVILDALLGAGATGPLRGTLPQLLTTVQKALALKHATPSGAMIAPAAPAAPAKTPIVAVDLPSGLDADTGEIDPLALSADVTVTFAAPKRGLFLLPGAASVGRLLVADIGITLAWAQDDSGPVLATGEMVASWLPRRSCDSHKGSHGKAMVVAGSTNYVGAPSLAAEAAYRVGAGLVTLGLATSVYPLVVANLREATYLLLPSDMGALVAEAVSLLAAGVAGYDALLVGPGLGSAPSTQAFMAKLLAPQRAAKPSLGFAIGRQEEQPLKLPPLVIDADGLNHLANLPHWWETLPAGTVLTPHPGEMARLTDLSTRQVQAQRWQLAADKARQWGCTVVLKGAFTVVAAPDAPLLISPFATPALATAGTGDVLAGMIVGLIAQGLATYQAAGVAVYVHGLAGIMAEQDLGQAGMLASELLPRIPLALRRLRDKGHGAN